MTTENLDPNPEAIPSSAALARRGRPLAIATAVVFFISAAFPLGAGLARNTAVLPSWWGVMDVSVALLLAVLAIALLALTQGRVTRRADEATYRAYRTLLHLILVVCMVYQLSGNRVIWSNCLPGFAWRAWLLLYALPAWFTAVGVKSSNG